MLKSGVILLAALLVVPVKASTQVPEHDGVTCHLLFGGEAPVIDPKRPDAPVRPDEAPPAPVPMPRRAPNPLPGRPLHPTEDPKDLIPIELYEQDGVASFWKSLAPEIRQALIQDADADFERLSTEFRQRYGVTPSLQSVSANVVRVLQRLKPIEQRHKTEVESWVQQLVQNRFGSSTHQLLRSEISNQLPRRPNPIERNHSPSDQDSNFSSPNNQTMDPDLWKFYVLRREFYNLLAQGEGWFGMMEFAADDLQRLQAMDPELLGLYSELDLNYRLAARVMLTSVPTVQTLQGEDVREQLTAGREVVSIEFRAVQGFMGEKQIEVSSVSGVAVGKNGWALAHEAFKAAFQITTALEATQRAPLNQTERQILDDLTNSNAAEIRQGIFGPGFRNRVQAFVTALAGSTDPHVYFAVVERVFSLLPDKVFQEFMLDCVRFDASQKIESYRKKYNEFLLLDEFL